MQTSPSITQQMAGLFRSVIFGGNWTAVNLKDTLADVSWQHAGTSVGSLNSMAVLLFHMRYYFRAVLQVLQDQPLTAKDKYSFDLPPLQNENDWQNLLNQTWADAEAFAAAVEALPEKRLGDTFADAKYGNYYRNIHGVIEHTHYHLGQMVIIKKLLAEKSA